MVYRSAYPSFYYHHTVGSSIATSLAYGESIPKKVGILEIYKDQFKIQAIPLKTVRPFVFEEILLERPDSENFDLENPCEQANKQIKARTNEILDRVKAEQKGKTYYRKYVNVEDFFAMKEL